MQRFIHVYQRRYELKRLFDTFWFVPCFHLIPAATAAGGRKLPWIGLLLPSKRPSVPVVGSNSVRAGRGGVGLCPKLWPQPGKGRRQRPSWLGLSPSPHLHPRPRNLLDLWGLSERKESRKRGVELWAFRFSPVVRLGLNPGLNLTEESRIPLKHLCFPWKPKGFTVALDLLFWKYGRSSGR